MRAHLQSDVHIQACTADLAVATTLRDGAIIEQIQNVSEQQRVKNRTAITALLRCTHFLTLHHIPHTTNFDELVDLIVSCGGQHLQVFLESAGKNAVYTSKDSVVQFVEALGQWVEESLLKRLHQAPFYSLMADECTDITTVEELSIYCRWVEDGLPVEHFLDIIPLTKVNAKTIYTTLVDVLRAKDIPLSKLVGMGFDGAATFSGKRNGVQSLLKKNSPHALYVHCHCHLLQLACVQAANHTPGIKHVYTTLTTLWKYFHYSPKRTERLKAVQRVLDLPELKVIKPSDTRWLAHERCVKAVKESYIAIVHALNDIYDEMHEPEALGISKALCKKSYIAAIYLLDYVLPQVAKLSKTLQAEKFDLTVVSALVESVLHSLDDALLPTANWVLELIDAHDQLDDATGIKVTHDDISSFQKNMAESFAADLKNNISSRFASQDVVSAFSVFNPQKMSDVSSSHLALHGEDSIDVLMNHYGAEKQAYTVQGEEFMKPPLITSEVYLECHRGPFWAPFYFLSTSTELRRLLFQMAPSSYTLMTWFCIGQYTHRKTTGCCNKTSML